LLTAPHKYISIYIILFGTPTLRNDVTEQSLYCNNIINDPIFISIETAQLTHVFHFCAFSKNNFSEEVNTQRTQISGRQYSNGTKHGKWPPEDGQIKSTETCRSLFVFTNIF